MIMVFGDIGITCLYDKRVYKYNKGNLNTKKNILTSFVLIHKRVIITTFKLKFTFFIIPQGYNKYFFNPG